MALFRIQSLLWNRRTLTQSLRHSFYLLQLKAGCWAVGKQVMNI